LALALAVILSSTAAWADFYVIAGGGAPGTKITSVPFTINNPGFYFLGGNLTYNGSGNAITVNVDDVTLDLMGFSLSGTSSAYGIYMDGRSNVEIRNGTVRGFYIGVYGVNSVTSNKHRAINIRATDNEFGIFLYGNNHLIQNCNSSNNGSTGLGLTTGTITNCVASNNFYGISVSGPGNVIGNIAFNNSDLNFELGNGAATAIMVDRNSAFGKPTNYHVVPGTTGVVMGTNAGTP
jgi:hypothetical protein